MTTPRIIPAAQLRAGPATVRVAFDSGDILTLSPRSALGVIDPRTRSAPRPRRAS